MKLTVLIPTHSKLALLKRTLASLSRQSYPADDFDVVVVDDGSTDDTPEFLKSFHANYTVQHLRLDANRGRAYARNRGLEKARGDVVVFLDDDMELVPEFLASHAELHKKGKFVAGVGNVVNHSEVTRAPIDRYMSTRGAQKVKNNRSLPWKYFSTNNASVQRAHIEAVGGFDESFIYYGFEDIELALRLVEKCGVTLEFVTGAKSLHIHPHTLDDVLNKKTLVGRHALPYLLTKHPKKAAEALEVDRFLPPQPGLAPSRNLKRRVFGVLLNPVGYGLAKFLAKLPLGALTTKSIDYLVLCSYRRGLQDPLPNERRESEDVS